LDCSGVIANADVLGGDLGQHLFEGGEGTALGTGDGAFDGPGVEVENCGPGRAEGWVFEDRPIASSLSD
jgi:hypothetical protein